MSAAPSNPSVLFVDDDPLILQGLRRSLRTTQREWSMCFVDSGPKALELMAAQRFDVIVSDMRMPGMNGAELLAEIKKLHPRTVRLILSGHADKELILQCVGTAHQFLTKPCEPEALRSAIVRGLALGSSPKSEQIKKLVVQMDKIPSIPAVYAEIVEKLRSEDTTIDEVGDLIAKDLGFTAKLLKLVNSAFFGLHREVTTPAEAASYIGLETIKALVLGVEAFGAFEGKSLPGFTLEALWKHSMSVAKTARAITESERVPRSVGDESFLAGLLHDIGKLILAVNLKDEYPLAVDLAVRERMPIFQAEEQLFGANHADVGGFVLSLWGLPSGVTEAITFHHEPQAPAASELNALIALHVADYSVNQAFAEGRMTEPAPLRREFLSALSMDHKLPAWLQIAL